MKRRLTRAYDRMTMPDSCAHRIEQKLNDQLLQQKTGCYIKSIPPAAVRKKGWTSAVAAVCLMLVLSVGGTVLFLRAAEHLRMNPQEIVAVPESMETAAQKTPSDWYSVATDFPVDKVEAFAKTVQHHVAMENWDALADKVSFPLTIQDQRISDKKTFVEWMGIFQLNPSFRDSVAAESCTAMFCNWQGICLGNGLIWINEVDGELKVTAINVEVQEEPEDLSQGKQVPEVFAEIISGDRIKMVGVLNKLTIEEYCANWWGNAKPDVFAVVDMDGDNVCELVFSLTDEQDVPCGSVVLRQEGSEICGYPFRSGEMLDLKKDGTFFRGDREHHLVFNDKTSCHTEEVKDQGEKPLAQWHTYPCQGATMLLQSYEFVTGTGQSLLPGNTYYHFEGLVLGSAGNDWNLQKEQMVRYGMICVEDEGTICVFDPDAPGTALYGVLTNENGGLQFSELGYYICTEEKEYMAEVWDLLSENPKYLVDVMDPEMECPVQYPEFLVGYFGWSMSPDADAIAEKYEAKAVVQEFTALYFSNNTKGMKAYLAADYRGDGDGYTPAGTAEIFTVRNLPEQVMAVGGTCTVGLELREPGQDSYSYFSLELVKQKDGWKVLSYSLEK